MINNSLNELTFLGEHISLNFINTVAKIDGEIVDYWDSSEKLLYWLAHVANINVPKSASSNNQALLDAAKELRELIRLLVQQKKEKMTFDFERLNSFLPESNQWLHIEYDKNQEIILKKYYKKDTPIQILAPLAEAAAELLIKKDFSLVKQCEHEDCILWFYDKTKAHRRRWCSMKICGNRHKVMKFRKKNLTNITI